MRELRSTYESEPAAFQRALWRTRPCPEESPRDCRPGRHAHDFDVAIGFHGQIRIDAEGTSILDGFSGSIWTFQRGRLLARPNSAPQSLVQPRRRRERRPGSLSRDAPLRPKRENRAYQQGCPTSTNRPPSLARVSFASCSSPPACMRPAWRVPSVSICK